MQKVEGRTLAILDFESLESFKATLEQNKEKYSF